MIEVLQQLYRLFLKHSQRKILRIASSFAPLRRFGFVACNRYIQLSVDSLDKFTEKFKDSAKVYTLVEENKGLTKSAKHLDDQYLDAIQPLTARTETVILDLNGEKFLFRDNHLFDDEMNVIDERGLCFERMPIYRKRLTGSTKKLEGTVAYLSNVEPSNYYHWMCRTLPLIRIYKKFFDLQEIDFFYTGQSPLRGFQEESLLKAGIRREQIIQQACTADRMIAAISSRTSYFGSAPIHWEAFAFIRELFHNEIVSHAGVARKRIYVARGNVNRRKVINEAEVIHLLQAYGFERVTMDDKTLQQQIEIFSQAEAIVAPHGAALTNLLFVQPGTTVIELIPYGYVNNCFYVLASYAEADYFYLQGKRTEQSGTNQHSLDLSIDIDKFNQICQMAFRQAVLQ